MSEITGAGTERKLKPEHPVWYVEEDKSSLLNPKDISTALVGQKVYGLSSLPPSWTLPFVCVSSELFQSYAAKDSAKTSILVKWSKIVESAAIAAGIEATSDVLVRSSGCAEGISRRGKYYSTFGNLLSIKDALRSCLDKLLGDSDLNSENIPLLIQRRCAPTIAKGHLSNERRCYEENRDWMGEIEANGSAVSHFQINLRHWRAKPQQRLDLPLHCLLSPRISEVLKPAADWAYRKQSRVHFEWVWDGRNVYLVQADEEINAGGHDPVAEHTQRNYSPVAFTPRVLRRVTASDAKATRFSKINNALIYLTLDLPTAPLYLLDDQSVIAALSEGVVSDAIREDISEMVRGSLVIRTDLATPDLSVKQLLPRTQEVRGVADALTWLESNSKVLRESPYEGAFIFHNFIPTQAAAFAYAAPNEPIVQIEALWGLPEGLYYNSHDKYVVDTVKPQIGSLAPAEIAQFLVREKRNFKRSFVSTTESGEWQTLILKSPFDWKGTLSERDGRAIAYESRRIANQAGHGVSIMWLVGIPLSVAASPAIPWHHEPFDVAIAPRTIATRTKTAFEHYFVVCTREDVELLRKHGGDGRRIKRIRVQPSEEALLRDKYTLKTIGAIAKELDAIIVLEGAILSHAYYQLIGTGAVVEVVHPFIGFEERHGFNKLVRDRIPELIQRRGERVVTARLNPDAFIKALREKLVEESFELLDAKDLGSIVAELADVREVIDSLMKQLSLTEKEVKEEQNRKREKRGGFSKALVLVETESMPPTSKISDSVQPHFDALQPSILDPKTIDENELRRRTDESDKRTDRRSSDGRLAIVATIQVPVVREGWSLDTSEEPIQHSGGVRINGSVIARRTGSNWSIELSVKIDQSQLELPFGASSLSG